MSTLPYSEYYQQTINYYNNHAQDFYEQTVNVDMSQLYRWFLKEVPADIHILDAGCGSGRDSLYFKQQGYHVTAMDPSAEMVRLSSELLGQKVLQKSFQELEYEEEFDGIWACASLLHVPRTEIQEVLQRLSRALKPGGRLFASFKHGDQEDIRAERFYNSYTEEAISMLLEGHPELELVDTQITEDARVDRQGERWLNVLIRKLRLLRGHNTSTGGIT